MASPLETQSAVTDPATVPAVNDATVSTPKETFPSSGATDPFVGRVLSHFRLEERLGAGGMGVLYRATDLKLKRSVAIKLLARHLVSDPSAEARFLKEAQAASALDHPNIGTVHAIGEENRELFIVMALYEGQTLKRRLENGPLAVDAALAILRQISLALKAAHSARIVHRDIKPSNILISRHGAVKVLDFGLAKLLANSQTETMTSPGHVMGTTLYMSPEQLRGEGVDPRSDLWSLGVVAYELVSGLSPFRANSSEETVSRILNDEPPSLAAVPGVPDWLALLVSQLLRKNPSERPQTASEVLQRLEPPATERLDLTAPAATAKSPTNIRLALLLAGTALVAAAPGISYYLFLRGSSRGTTSIAVLPFTSLSTGEENAYLSQGFHGELIRQIGRIDDLSVISQTSVMQYKDTARNLRQIADALGVSFIVEGSVQRDGSRVSVAATLIDARDDRQIWGDRYDRDLNDIFDIQTTVAEEIASALHARLPAVQKARIAHKSTESPEAYDLYLRGLEYANRPGFEPENLGNAEGFYRQAIQIDPSFALARARLASVMMARYWFVAGTPESVAEAAKEEAEQSLRLQRDLPEAHLALGLFHYWRWRDFEPAVREFEIARHGVPTEATLFIGVVRRRQGKFEEAIRNQQQAIRLDPRSPVTFQDLALSFVWTRKYEEADRMVDRALAIAPDLVGSRILKAFVRAAWRGETDLARDVLHASRGRLNPKGSWGLWIDLMMFNPQEALRVLDSVESESITNQDAVYPKAFLYAVAHEALGDAAQAQQEYEAARPRLEAEVEKSPNRATQRTLLARAYAGLGRMEEGLREARRAVEILPVSKDAFVGSNVEIERAAVEARVGETDAALEHIRHLLSIPCVLSPALLRIDPRWAPLRGNSRFGQLAEIH